MLEEPLEGIELSYIVMYDGKNYTPLPVAQDYKRLTEDPDSPNTGGMGSYAPVTLSRKLEERITNELVGRTIRGLKKEGLAQPGILYFGIMITKDGPKLLEYNCRFGDPETQATLPLRERPRRARLFSAWGNPVREDTGRQ